MFLVSYPVVERTIWTQNPSGYLPPLPSIWFGDGNRILVYFLKIFQANNVIDLKTLKSLVQ